MRYTITLVNVKTGESQRTNWGFTNKKDACEWADKWCGLDGGTHGCKVWDKKTKQYIY